ncbi:hypothetical protein LOZ51_004280 [Ophidiomyces ophidiicola]|nr:hypothetical protein LOZ60_002358 [Ophidiomyces ophidiicola]KAI1992964.1 hypothetical protein LOZ51_004280 [Ophidiomyces ophidiicola]KAI2407405.1 hypothetical protein LOY90_003327 [Ophidiomyces ophidiicola]
MSEVSSTRLYLGNLPRNDLGNSSCLDFVFPVTKQDVEEHFGQHGSGKITDIKLMNGFGFIEYEDALDARDVVPAFRMWFNKPSSLWTRGIPILMRKFADGTDFKGSRLTVQFARGPRHKETFSGPSDRSTAPRPRRTIYRMQISGLPETSWQDLKDFARQSGLDVVYSETSRDHEGRGFVEFETGADLKTAVDKLDGREFKGARVTCTQDIQNADDRPPRDPYRSRSPMRRGPPPDDYERRGGHPRGYSPRGHYRERSPPPIRREYYDREGYGRRSPPPRTRIDDYPPPRRPYDDPYDFRPPPRHYDDPYNQGRYGRRPMSPPPRGDYGGYDRRGYW